MNDCEHQIFKPCVILFDARSLKQNEETLAKVSRYIRERGGRVMSALLTHKDSENFEILPSPKKGTRCTHIVAEDGVFDRTWRDSFFSECGVVTDDAKVVNLVWVFACMQAHRLLPCNIGLYTSHRMRTRPVDLPKNGIDTSVRVYPDDTMDISMSVSCSGFKKVARTLLEAMAGSMGLTFHKDLHVSGMTKTDALIVLDTSDTSSAKLQAAKTANIPVLSFMWMLNSFKEWKLLRFDDPEYQNGCIDDLNCLIEEEEEEKEEEKGDGGLVPDSESSDSVRECSPTPPVENLSVSGGELVSLASPQKVRDISSGSIQPISQDLSSTSISSASKYQKAQTAVQGIKKGDDNDKEEEGEEQQEPKKKKEKRKQQPSQEEEERKLEKKKVRKGEKKQQGKSEDPTGSVSKKQKGQAKKTADKKDGTDGAIIRAAPKKNPSTMHITLSGMHSNEQNEYLPLLRALCIPFTAGTHSWNHKFTHVLTHSLRRNQKCLCALACGAWILHPSFLKACPSSQNMVSEESYEITSGNKANHIDPKMPRFWRTTIAARAGRRAFEGLVCSLYRIASSSTPSREDIRAIITAGGGTVIPHYKAADESCDLVITTSIETARSSIENKEMHTKLISSSDIVLWLVSTSTDLAFKTTNPKVSSLLDMRRGG